MSRRTVLTLRFRSVIILAAVSIGVGVFLQSVDARQPAESPHKSSEAAGAAADLAVAHAESPWSKEVNGLQARIVLKWMQVCNGTPIIAPFLELRNVSNRMNPMKLAWRREKMKFRVVDAQGHEPPPAGAVHSGPVVDKLDLIVPCRGTLAFDTSMGGWGIHGDKAGQLESWVFDRDDKDYCLQVVLEIPGSDRDKDGFSVPWEGKIEIPPVLVPLKRVEMDPAKVGPIIRELGGKMFGANSDASEKAARALSLIDDPRVIPWYVKAMDTDNYELKCAALDRLARFNSDAALEGIKKGMKTRGIDLADHVRHSAAWALLRSPHPEAKKLLLSMWNDPYPAVRNTVLHALGKMDSEESLALLRKMSRDDPDEGQRNEAIRILKLRTEKGKKQ